MRKRRRMLRKTRRLLRALVGIAVVLGIILGIYVFSRARPQDVPWTPLDLGQPIGAFTGRKIAALTDEPALCRALLDRAGARHDVIPPFGTDQCLVEDGLKLAGGARRITLLPENPRMACPVAAGLAVWEWEVVQPAARRIFGQSVAAIDHLGTWNCRRIAGSQSWSQHSTADAIDVAGFRLADGTVITVLRDWKGDAKKAEFLRTVRDGACDLFSTVLSPDYNAAHADHLHIDQARRGAMSRRPCR
jgi:hypothetical protein